MEYAYKDPIIMARNLRNNKMAKKENYIVQIHKSANIPTAAQCHMKEQENNNCCLAYTKTRRVT